VTTIPDDKAEIKAYTQDEITTFKQNAVLDIHRLRHQLALANEQAERVDNSEQIYHFIGLENYISQARMRSVRAARRAHVVAVLWEQQSLSQPNDVNRLASVSTASSRQARARAEQMAAEYMNLRG